MKKIKSNKKLLIAIVSVAVLSIAFIAVAFASPANTKTEEIDEPVNTETVVTETVAMQLASEAIDSTAVFQSIELGDENGTIIFEATYLLDNNQIEVKVDATTGVVLGIEADSDTEEPDEAYENDVESFEENESVDGDYDVDGIVWKEEGENSTEN